MKSSKIIILISFLFLFSYLNAVFADVTSFIFTTDPQNVPTSELSNKITIHSETPVAETTYITLTSNSNTGQFFSNTTSIEPIVSGSYVYISSGNSNRTVYYKDSTSGDFIITANIFNKAKTQQLATITQHIYIGQASSNFTATDQTATTTDQTTSDTTSSSDQTTSSVVSAHSSPAPLSNTENKMEFEISAGRDRLTTVGNNLVFVVTPTKLQNVPESGITYFWSFGDGTIIQGNNVNHTYKFAGDYSVVVNANYSDKQAVSRMKVEVVSPVISIAKVSGGVEIFNNSKVEINLEGWKLVSPGKTFIFPTDTLIPSGKKVIFADEVTGMLDETIQLLNPIGKELGSVKKTEVEEAKYVAMSVTNVNLDDIQVEIEGIKNKVAQISGGVKDNIKIVKPIEKEMGLQTNNEPVADLSEKNFSSTTNMATVFEATRQKGFVSTVFSWPIKGFNFVRRLFVEE